MDRQNKLLAHTQRNAELIGVFTEKQIPLDASRSIELHFWAWSQPNSVRLAYELYKKGFMLLLLKPALLQNDPSRWNIEAGAKVSITTVASEEFTAGLVDLASSVEADYDGWGTSI